MVHSGTLGTWIWNIRSISKADEVIAFLKSKGVSEAYLAYHPQTPHAEYRNFVRQCSLSRIRVAPIGADAAWILERGAREFRQFLDWFREYQAGCGSVEEKFYGIHFDVEPHQLAEWETQTAFVVERYKEFVLAAERFCREENVLLEVDIPFWFDKYTVADREEQLPLS
mgnify:FL=1